jgi:hypothetical protein
MRLSGLWLWPCLWRHAWHWHAPVCGLGSFCLLAFEFGTLEPEEKERTHAASKEALAPFGLWVSLELER